MRFAKYLSYFLYLGTHWNFRIATKLLREEITGEKKYGIRSTGFDELKHLKKLGVDTSHASVYMPASFVLIEDLFDRISISSKQHFLDLGCGKGRALAVAAHRGVPRVTGVDISKKLLTQAEENMQRCREKFPELQYSLILNDAFYYEIDTDVDCIFLFNPFDAFVMESVSDNIQKSLDEKDRKITLIYLNSLHKKTFLENGFKETYHTENLTYLQASILEYDPASFIR